MRTTKIVSGLVALVMAMSMMLAFTSVTSPANGVAVAAKKPAHDLTAQGEEYATNKFRIVGKVSTYPGKKITVQRKVNKGAYQNWTKVKTKANGNFKFRIYGGKRGSKICYKIIVPKTKDYKTTKRAIACITTI